MICRDIDCIQGFTREILIALTTNIESREARKICISVSNLHVEHPRASTRDFTLKQVAIAIS